MASRIIAQLLVAGATTVLRAGTQAWQKALQNAKQSGVAHEAVNKAAKATGGMTAQEARMILEVDPNATWLEVTKRYKHMFEVNQKYGSFYLQSKVYRAWEALDQEYATSGRKTPDDEAAVQRLLHQEPAEQAQQQQQEQQQQQKQ